MKTKNLSTNVESSILRREMLARKYKYRECASLSPPSQGTVQAGRNSCDQAAEAISIQVESARILLECNELLVVSSMGTTEVLRDRALSDPTVLGFGHLNFNVLQERKSNVLELFKFVHDSKQIENPKTSKLVRMN